MTVFPSSEDQAAIGQALAAVAPSGWSTILLVYQEVGPTSTYVTQATVDGEVKAVSEDLDWDAEDLLSDLRKRMYRPQAGTWYTATVEVRAEGRTLFDFDYDSPPAFDFAPNSWADDAERFPRARANSPAWLLAKVEQPDWVGASWQIDLTAEGRPVPQVEPLDATTTAEGRAWCLAIADQLSAAGHRVESRQDEGEDGRGKQVAYDELVVHVGQGCLAVAFWRDEVLFTAQVEAGEAEKAELERVAQHVLRVVSTVTGYRTASPLTPYTAHLLAL